MSALKRASVVIIASLVAGIAVVAIVFMLPRGFPNLFSSMVKVIGVYPVAGDQDTCMIEVIVKASASEFEIEMFSQDGNSAYGEHYLSSDGSQVISSESESQIARLVFLMNNVSVERPLFTPFGPVAMPNLTPMPGRLRGIIDFDGN